MAHEMTNVKTTVGNSDFWIHVKADCTIYPETSATHDAPAGNAECLITSLTTDIPWVFSEHELTDLEEGLIETYYDSGEHCDECEDDYIPEFPDGEDHYPDEYENEPCTDFDF